VPRSTSQTILGCLDPGNCDVRTEIFRAFCRKLPALQNPTFRYRGLDNRYRAFKTPPGNQCLYRQDEKAKT
jgi:hypothetical protein